jgi:hypothetical protein
MNSDILQTANEAIYQLQFNTREAISYVMRNAHTNREAARAALQKVMMFHVKSD